MAVLPLSPTPFFANKNQAFWNLQLAGWGGAFLLRAVSALANGQPLDLLAVILVTTITGFSISLILSVVYGYLIRQRPLVTWGGTALVLGVAVGASVTPTVLGQLPQMLASVALVPVYILVIASMLVFAAGTWGQPGALMIILGAWGFAFSDLAVARRQFVSADRINGLWGTPLYFGSQMMLAASLAWQGNTV